MVRNCLTRIGGFDDFHMEPILGMEDPVEIMVCLVLNGKDLPHKENLVKSLVDIPGMKSISINVNLGKTNVILGERIKNLWGEDPATLARDLKYLCEKDYKLEKVRAVDQFGHSVHVETCVLLSHENS